MILSTTVTGFQPGEEMTLEVDGQCWSGLILQRMVEADTVSGGMENAAAGAAALIRRLCLSSQMFSESESIFIMAFASSALRNLSFRFPASSIPPYSAYCRVSHE